MKASSASPAGAVALGLLALCGLSASNARAGLTHDYEFKNTLADSLGGPSLVSLGGTVGPSGYTFGAQQGLSLSGALATPGTYTIDMHFEFDTLSGYRKILDFKNLASDNGLYNLNTNLNYYPVTTSPGSAFTAGSFARVDLTRDATTGLVVGYVDGVQAISFTDSSGDATFGAANSIINFFQDDTVTGGRESTSGSVDQIRIYDNALSAGDVAALGIPSTVPEPSSLALCVIAGTIGLVIARARSGRPA